jgi:glycosyltransferase involved in cell wall biosynthesis
MTDSSSDARPLVSVVIACFNHACYLAEAIKSALAQTYSPVEIVVVDDGSTDDSAQVARCYPVQVVHQTNQGLAAASNAGVRASRGTFVMRLDADDRLKPTYVEETLRLLLDNPDLHFVYTQVEYFGARSGSYPIEEFDPETLAQRNYINASAMMRRASFEVVGGYCEALSRVRCEDWDLWLSFADHKLEGKMLARPLLEYRRHPHGSMANFNLLSPRSIRREIELVSHLQQHHPEVFAPTQLLRRLRRLPGRVTSRHASIRFTSMLIAFYSVMLARSASQSIQSRRVALTAS